MKNTFLLELKWKFTGFLQSVANLFFLEIKFYNPSNSEKALLKYLLDKHKIDLVLDVGASKGLYAKKIMGMGYSKAIYSFEPLKEAFQELQKKSLNSSNWKAFHYGMGDTIASMTINVSHNSDSSSILGMHETHVKNSEVSGYVSSEEIQIKTLESVFTSENIQQQNIFLKIDVQGYEKKVIEGARDYLKQVSIIQIELSLTPLYEGGVLIEEIISIMRANGFELYSLVQGFKSKTTGQLFQMDGFFVRKSLL